MIWQRINNQWTARPLHNATQGWTAIVVCGGPSLNKIDTARLCGPGRVVIAVNSAYPRVRPDFWVGMDSPDNHDSRLWSEAFPKVLRSGLHNSPVRDKTNVLFADVVEGDAVLDDRDVQFRWHKDSFRIALQLAQHLGCERIALVGVDLSMAGGHYADGSQLTESQAAYNQRLYDAQFEALKTWPLPLVSCSPDSRINELMPFVTLDELIREVEPPPEAKRPHCLAPVAGGECDEFAALKQRGFKPYSQGHQAMYRAVVELLRGKPARVLEVGFGIGCGLEWMRAAGVLRHYSGCEPVKAAFDYAREQQLKLEPHPLLSLNNCGWQSMSVGGEFDIGLCIEVLEHLPVEDRVPVLEWFRAHCRTLFLSTPDSRDSGHGVFTTDEVHALLAQAGWHRSSHVRHQWTTLFIATDS